MNDVTLFTYCSIISFSGFSIAFYGTLSQKMIENISFLEHKKGYDLDKDEEHFSKKFELWNCGSFFLEGKAVIIGLFIAFLGSLINLISNQWWSILLTLVVGYFTYLFVAKTIKKYIQLICIITLIISIALILIHLI